MTNFAINFAIIFYYEFDSKITAFTMSIVYVKFNMILSWLRNTGCQNGKAAFQYQAVCWEQGPDNKLQGSIVLSRANKRGVLIT